MPGVVYRSFLDFPICILQGMRQLIVDEGVPLREVFARPWLEACPDNFGGMVPLLSVMAHLSDYVNSTACRSVSHASTRTRCSVLNAQALSI